MIKEWCGNEIQYERNFWNSYNIIYTKKYSHINKYNIFNKKYRNFIFFLLLILDYFIWVKESQSKELLDKYILINFVLFSFYLCKEPLFFFSINKIVFLFLVSLIQILLIIFTYKIKINFSLKELLKVFMISGIVYYLPNILLRIFFKIIY